MPSPTKAQLQKTIAALRREIDRPLPFGLTAEQAVSIFFGQMPRRERLSDVGVRVAARLKRRVAR